MKFILSHPLAYRLFNSLISGNAPSIFVNNYLKPCIKDNILDIGSGTADIISYLPQVNYVGIDLSPQYIDYAKKRYGSKATFICGDIVDINSGDFSSFDIVLAQGVLHHLDDNKALSLLKLAKSAIKANGRFLSVDGCFIEGQSRITRFILSNDRGNYVRTKEQYIQLASQVFTKVNVHIRSDLLRIPYTHIIMECTP